MGEDIKIAVVGLSIIIKRVENGWNYFNKEIVENR